MPTNSAAALRFLCSLSLAAAPLAARAQATSAACKPVLDASTKEISTPHHLYQTETSSAKNDKGKTAELISTATANYILYQGKWIHSRMTPQASLAQMQENLRNSKVYECRKLPDASIGGVPTAVYSAHSETDMAKTNTQLWVAKSTGLILREEIDVDDGDADGKRHMSMRFDYSNVKPPPGVK